MSVSDTIRSAFECSCDSMEEVEEDDSPINPVEDPDDVPDEAVSLLSIARESRTIQAQLEAAFEAVQQLGNIYHAAETASTASTTAADVKFLNAALESEYRRLELPGAFLEYGNGRITDASMESVFDFIGKIITGIGAAWDGFIERMRISNNTHSNGTIAISKRIQVLNNYLNKSATFEASGVPLKFSPRRLAHLCVGKQVATDIPKQLSRLVKLRETLVNTVSNEVATYSDKIYDGLPRSVVEPKIFEAELKKLIGKAPDVDALWKKLDDGQGDYLGLVTLERSSDYKPSAHVPNWFADFQRYVEYSPYYLTAKREKINEAVRSASVDTIGSEQIRKDISEVEVVIDKMINLNNGFSITWSRNYQKWKSCRDKVWNGLSAVGDDYSRAQVTLMRIAMLSGEYNFSRTMTENDYLASTYIMACDAVVARAEQSFLQRPR